MIAIIDYGMGNLRSVQKAFETVGHQAVVTRERRVIADASHVVLPGVGAFADCMANLEQYGLIEPIRDAIASGKPFLGICLGLQLLFTESEEFGLHKGLNLVPGRVKRFPSARVSIPASPFSVLPAARPPEASGGRAGLRQAGQRSAFSVEGGQTPPQTAESVPRLKVPHMGWNDVTITRQAPPLQGVGSRAYFYFVHSYYVEPSDPSVVCSVTDYGVPFASSVWRDNIFACQFHPEKSQTVGLSIIRNFGRWQ